MNEPIWVLHEVVLSVHQMLLAEHGGLAGIRDQALLDSALNRPKQRFTYDDDISIFNLSASYSFGLAKNHPFIDGNKRIALAISAIFLELNGYSLNASEAEAVIIFEKIADSTSDFPEDELANWLEISSSLNT